MHQRARRLGVAAITLALVTLVGVAYAQTSPTSATPSPTTSSWTASAVTGTVMSVDPQARSVTIKTDAGSTQAFLLSDPIGMRSAGKDISINELKVGDRVRIEPAPGAGSDEPTRTASRLEVLGTAETPSMTAGTQPGTPQRTVSTERPVLGEPADAGENREALPSSAGSTTGRTVSTDRPVLGQNPSTTGTTGTSAGASTYGTPSPPSTTGTGSATAYGSSPTTPSPSTTGTSAHGSSSTAPSTSSADELPATASPLPLLGFLGLLALTAGFAVRATRKQHS